MWTITRQTIIQARHTTSITIVAFFFLFILTYPAFFQASSSGSTEVTKLATVFIYRIWKIIGCKSIEAYVVDEAKVFIAWLTFTGESMSYDICTFVLEAKVSIYACYSHNGKIFALKAIKSDSSQALRFLILHAKSYIAPFFGRIRRVLRLQTKPANLIGPIL